MRLDLALVDRGLARSRSHARQLIDAGAVALDGGRPGKPSTQVTPDTAIQVVEDPYVSRAAHKLIHALDASGLRVPDRVLDAGASTGGFTQVLLERGAKRVYAVDVGHGQMAASVRGDPRVVNREGLNLRELTLADVDGQAVDLAVADVSFISLTLVLAPILSVLAADGQALLLVKPQFEVGRAGLDSHGVVRDESVRRQAVAAVVGRAAALGWDLVWQSESGLPGQDGNREIFCLFISGRRSKGAGDNSPNGSSRRYS